MTCTATLTTLTPTNDVVAKLVDSAGQTYLQEWVQKPHDGVTVTRHGDRLLRANVTVEECAHDAGHSCQHASDHAVWTDDTPGATPHRDPTTCPDCDGTAPTVTDAEVFAAIDAYHDITAPEYGTLEGPVKKMRRALEAAARARQDNQ